MLFDVNQLVSITDVTRNFKKIKNQINSTQEPCVILDNNKPCAVILSVEQFNALTENNKSDERKLLKFKDFATEEDREILKKAQELDISDEELLE